MTKDCSNCAYSMAISDDAGMCKRYPPVFMKGQKEQPFAYSWQQPIISLEDWCGEFKESKE